MAQGSSVKLDDYREVAPRGAVDFLLRIGERLQGRRLVHVSASRYAGSVVETLNRLVPILNDLGVDTSWEVTIGGADFDTVTRSVGRALAGTEQVITEGMLGRLRDTCADNARRLQLDADLVVVGRRSRSLRRLVLGSVSAGVARQAPCDVLIVR